MSNRGNLQCGVASSVLGTGGAQQIDALDGVLLGFIYSGGGVTPSIQLNDANPGTANTGINPQIPPVAPAAANLMLNTLVMVLGQFVPMQAVYKNGLQAVITTGASVTFIRA